MKILNKLLLFGIVLSNCYSSTLSDLNVDLENNNKNNLTLSQNTTCNSKVTIGKYGDEYTIGKDGNDMSTISKQQVLTMKTNTYTRSTSQFCWTNQTDAVGIIPVNTEFLFFQNMRNSIPAFEIKITITKNDETSQLQLAVTDTIGYFNMENYYKMELSQEEGTNYKLSLIGTDTMDVYQVDKVFRPVSLNQPSSENIIYKLGSEKNSGYNDGDITEEQESETNLFLYKYNSSSQKWFLTNEDGTFKDPSIELNKATLTIPPDYTLTVQNDGHDNIGSLTVSNLGKIVNKGKIELQNYTSIYAPAAELSGTATNEWEKIISNLDDVAIDNTDGTIILNSNSRISTEDLDGFPIIKGGTVDVTNYNQGHILQLCFYNVNLKVWPENLFTKELINMFSNELRGGGAIPLNTKFFQCAPSSMSIKLPDIQPVIIQKNENNINYTLYETTKDVIQANEFEYNNKNITINILRFFFPAEKITDEFLENSPLKIKFIQNEKPSIYDLLNNPSDYIDEYDSSKEYALDLLSFNVNNRIDYNKLTNGVPSNIQFVTSKYLTLKPKDGENKLNIGKTYSNYSNVLSFDDSIEEVTFDNSDNTKNGQTFYIYKVKLNNNMIVNTKGNIKLLLDNSGTVNLNGLHHDNGNLLMNSNNNKSLIIQIPSTEYTHSTGSIVFNSPISKQLL